MVPTIADTQLIGQSPAFLDLLDAVSRVAPLDRPVLVIGERGTGKELIAARLHYLSRRWDSTFLQMNCAALSESLLDSELFGHEAGAFTGAARTRIGRFEAANGGTLFLDEIAAMSGATQEKLLRVIEYGQFQRVGANDTIMADVRIIGATNVDLPTLATRGEFRADLLDRLSFDVLTVPPLRQRRDDILPLAEHFARAMAGELGWRGFPGFTAEAEARMIAYPWPGNVRQLKNVAERAVYRWRAPEESVARIVIDPFVSPFRPAAASNVEASAPVQPPSTPETPDRPYDFKDHIAREEHRLIADALERCRHNQRTAASFLNLSYDQFRHAARKHGLI